jgi:hypothetical protein
MTFTPVKMPTVLASATNGDLHADLLAPIGDRTVMLKTPAAWYGVLQDEFHKATGRVLSFTYGGGYRTWQQQYNLFVSRYKKVGYATYAVTPSNRRKIWQADPLHRNSLGTLINPTKSYWVLIQYPNGKYPAMAASPGTSNHGWGLAVDLAIGTPSTAVSLSASDRTWLEANVARFGFSYESASEPWHIRYVAGDVCPPYINEKH